MGQMRPQNDNRKAFLRIWQRPTQLSVVVGVLEAVLDPLSLATALDEEAEITPEMATALDRARALPARGEGIPREEILPDLGLNLISGQPALFHLAGMCSPEACSDLCAIKREQHIQIPHLCVATVSHHQLKERPVK